MTGSNERADFDAWWTGEYGWHSIRAEWADTPTDAAWMAWQMRGEEVTRLRAEVERLRAALGDLVDLVEMQDELNTPPTDAYVALGTTERPRRHLPRTARQQRR